MNKTISAKPIQAGDYGKNIILAPVHRVHDQSVTGAPQTDGQKTLSLWSR